LVNLFLIKEKIGSVNMQRIRAAATAAAVEETESEECEERLHYN